MKSCPDTYYITVIEDLTTKRVIGTATLVIEQKFIHSASIVSITFLFLFLLFVNTHTYIYIYIYMCVCVCVCVCVCIVATLITCFQALF